MDILLYEVRKPTVTKPTITIPKITVPKIEKTIWEMIPDPIKYGAIGLIGGLILGAILRK
jgi:hypothetical protein